MRELAVPYYVEDVGRPSIDPIVLVKLMIVGALEGIGSTRELLRQASMRLDLRRFLGYGLAERLLVHQTLSHAHTRRFVDAALFERLFVRSLELCKQHGLVEGTHLSIDGFHTEANAALGSLRASLALASAPEAEAGVEGEPAGQLAITAGPPDGQPGGERPALTLAEPHSGPTPRRRSSNASSVSRTDPEAKLRGKPGQRPHLVYRGQIAVDRKQRVIVACRGEGADGFEGDALEPLLDRARFACPELESIGADSGFAAERPQPSALDRHARPARREPTHRPDDPPLAAHHPRSPHTHVATVDTPPTRPLALATQLHRGAHPHPRAPRRRLNTKHPTTSRRAPGDTGLP